MSSAERAQVIWLAISLNPWHDTPITVKTFLTSHGVTVPIHYLLGSVSQLAPVWGNYHIQSVLQSEWHSDSYYWGLCHRPAGTRAHLP